MPLPRAWSWNKTLEKARRIGHSAYRSCIMRPGDDDTSWSMNDRKHAIAIPSATGKHGTAFSD